MSKVMSMREAMARFVRDGMSVVMEGFTHLIPFAAGHELIRQRRRNLTLIRLTPDLLFDQMIAAGCARKLVFSWAGNPGVGSLHAFRRAVEQARPQPLELEEYSHFGLALRLQAGAAYLPFLPTRNFAGSDLPRANPNLKPVVCPYTGQQLWAVPALEPDVAILHAQRADQEGNTQAWGLTGVLKEAAFAARRVVVVVEEIVSGELIRRDPNRTLLPGFKVDAVVEESFGAHPSYVQGYYDRDNDFYQRWEEISRREESLQAYLATWVFGVSGRQEYRERLGETVRRLRAASLPCEPVNYGY
ncbi:MAG: CoA transferase subunit A [Acidobacteria bacterium]|nr:CoA transferase subunit A [Acidobacteriota bacterium]